MAPGRLLLIADTHVPKRARDLPGRLRLLNPGSPTDRRRPPYCTYMTAAVGERRLYDVQLHRSPPRTRPS